MFNIFYKYTKHHFILITTLSTLLDKYYYYLHFIKKETEAQKGKIIYSRSDIYSMIQSGLKCTQLDSSNCAVNTEVII